MDAAVAALLGTVFGAVGSFGGSFGGSWLQQRHTTKRERVKLATELAMAERNEFREATLKRGGGPMLPIAAYIAYHVDMLEAMESGTFNPTKIAELEQRQADLLAALPRRFGREIDGRS